MGGFHELYIPRRSLLQFMGINPILLHIYPVLAAPVQEMEEPEAPLCVEGWDEALHEIGRLSFETIPSPQNAAALLQAVEDLPVLVIAGAEDAFVPLKSVQAMASKLVNSRLVAISGCGHLPHEECPKALFAAIAPFISRLLLGPDLQDQ
ncbi:hypothetical protein F0562_007226 [Nyssa sinensis]|uniref:AB hydrolase-1 domain-containing protein n=1 Tax=Nyssa sinensis TaxID=561372 RepID=A0A5J5A5S7_9ASTE|nr:hypothetical protein F0562_007226 [Nyssa sinensis]